jgi:hypothetical protein
MATITLNYNPRNSVAKKTVEYIRSLGVFKIEEGPGKRPAIDMALEEVKKGRVTHCTDFDDYLKKVK